MKLHSNGCIMDGPIDGFMASCASNNCKNYQNLHKKVLKLCLEKIGVAQIVSNQEIYQNT